MIPRLKSFNKAQNFIYPDGKHLCKIANIIDNSVYYITNEIFEIDLYTGNGLIEAIPCVKEKVDSYTFKQLANFFVENNVDFYPYWAISIDRLVRFCRMNVAEAIQYQLYMPRPELYEFIEKKKVEMFPASVNLKHVFSA